MGEAKRRREAGHIPGHKESAEREPGTLPLWIWALIFVVVVGLCAWLSPARAIAL